MKPDHKLVIKTKVVLMENRPTYSELEQRVSDLEEQIEKLKSEKKAP